MPGTDGITAAGACATTATRHRSSCSPRGTRSRTASPGSTPAPTTTWSSRSRSKSCSRVCTRSLGAGRVERTRCSRPATSGWTPPRTIVVTAAGRRSSSPSASTRSCTRLISSPASVLDRDELLERRLGWSTSTARTSSRSTSTTCATRSTSPSVSARSRPCAQPATESAPTAVAGNTTPDPRPRVRWPSRCAMSPCSRRCAMLIPIRVAPAVERDDRRRAPRTRRRRRRAGPDSHRSPTPATRFTAVRVGGGRLAATDDPPLDGEATRIASSPSALARAWSSSAEPRDARRGARTAQEPLRSACRSASCRLPRRATSPRRGALRPVAAMTRRARDVSAGDSDARLPVPDSRDEIAELGHTLNDMLARLHRAIERERLRRRGQPRAPHPADHDRRGARRRAAHRRSEHEYRAALETAAQENRRVAALAEDLFVLARADQGRLPMRPEPVDIGVSCARRATESRLAPPPSEREVLVSVDEDLFAVADEFGWRSSLDNLTDNALRYAQIAWRARATGRRASSCSTSAMTAGASRPPSRTRASIVSASPTPPARARTRPGPGDRRGDRERPRLERADPHTLNRRVRMPAVEAAPTRVFPCQLIRPARKRARTCSPAPRRLGGPSPRVRPRVRTAVHRARAGARCSSASSFVAERW